MGQVLVIAAKLPWPRDDAAAAFDVSSAGIVGDRIRVDNLPTSDEQAMVMAANLANHGLFSSLVIGTPHTQHCAPHTQQYP